MEKKLNLLGIRKKVILCHTKSLAGVTYTVMRPITEEDEQNLDKFEYLDIDNKRIDKKDIYCYNNKYLFYQYVYYLYQDIQIYQDFVHPLQ